MYRTGPDSLVVVEDFLTEADVEALGADSHQEDEEVV